VAKAFLKASEQQKSDGGAALPESYYNAGLAYMRCGIEKEAIAQYETASSVGGGFHRARAQLALFEYQKTKDLSGTISKLEGIIRDAKFQNAEALVGVAALQMERGSDEANSDGKNDLERAKKNIQRALAIDDSFMPAFNQGAFRRETVASTSAGGRGRTWRECGSAAARARRIGGLTRCAQESQLRADPQYGWVDPGRNEGLQQGRAELRQGTPVGSQVLRGAHELRGGELVVPRLR
jgi:tetratricopeptide (TPR) repeat protein